MKKRLLAIGLAFVMLLSIATPAMAAVPFGATNKEVVVSDSPVFNNKNGVYIANDAWNSSISAFTTGANSRVGLPGAQYHMQESWLGYVFNPDDFDNIQFHTDGFPMRIGHRTVVDQMGEMRYLAQKYPDLTKLHLLGWTQGIRDNITNTNTFNQLFDERGGESRRVPVYALEICNNPGVQEGRPATLHQGANHGGEQEACEMALNLCWYLTTQYGKDSTDAQKQITNLLDTTRVFIIPYTNPEGSIANMRNNGTTVNGRQTGWASDPNRNWAYRWGSNNGSGQGATGRGRGPGSDPEGQNITSLYRSNQVISSISGHTSGQIIIYAWASFYNPADAHPLLTELAYEQASINGHTPQNGHVMYAQSGEINDYLWGAMRALGFTYEYGQSRPLPYIGTSTGENYILTSYDIAAGIDRPIRVGAYSSASGAGKPAADLTAKLVWLDAFKHNGVPMMYNEYITVGYQNVGNKRLSNGMNREDLSVNSDAVGSSLRRITPALIENWLTQNPGVVTDKIFISHVPQNQADGNTISAALKAAGAVGWMVSNTTNVGDTGRTDGGSYGAPSANYGAPGFPVFGFIKGYSRDIFDHAKADNDVTITLKADTRDVISMYYNWDRQKRAYMRNMEYAREYANQLSGTIFDGNGQKLANATLEASLVIESLVVDGESCYQDDDLVVPRSYNQQSQEMQRTTYDVEGGDYNWFMLPSKQTEYADKGWTVTAKAPGRYLETRNVRFALGEKSGIASETDSAIIKADPLFQQKITGVNFDLPVAFAVDQDLNALLGDVSNTVTFTTFNKDGVAADVVGAFVNVNGTNVEVENTGIGKYTATFSGAVTIEVGFPGAEPLTAGDLTSKAPLRDAIMEKADMQLRSDSNGVVLKGKEFGLKTSFVKNIPTNVVRLTYNYDSNLFTADKDTSKANFEAAGFSVLDVKTEDGQIQYTLMNKDQSYGMKRFYGITLKERFYIFNEDGTRTPTYDSTNGQWWTTRGATSEAYTNDLSELKKRIDGEPFDYYSEYIYDPAVNADGTINTERKLGTRAVGDSVRFWDLDEEFTDATFIAKSDIDFTDGFQTITVVADYVDGDIDVVNNQIVLKSETKVDKLSNIAMVTFATSGISDLDFTLVLLSNLIDAFGFDASYPDWYTKYIFWDFNGDNVIDIFDIVYVAVRIR